MKRLATITMLSLSLAAACNYGTMTETSYDAKAGTSRTTSYSKYYEATGFLVPETIGLHLVVDLEKKQVPGVYGIKESLGLLTGDDAVGSGVFTIYIFNLTDRPQVIEIRDALHDGKTFMSGRQTVSLEPRERKKKAALGTTEVSTYAKILRVDISVTYRDEIYKQRLEAKRQTEDDLKRKYGSGGTGPDFPWVDRR
jgi:hypothetical protein